MEEATQIEKDREIQSLQEENVRLLGRFSQLSNLALRILSTLDLPAVLQEVVDAACELTRARYGALAVFAQDARIQHFITHGLTPEERTRVGDPPKGVGLLGWLRQLPQPLRLANLSQHPLATGFPPGHPHMTTFLGVPLRLGQETLGALYLTEKADGQEFTQEDEDLLVLSAAQATMAIRNAWMHQQSQAHLEEAERIAKDIRALHDLTRLAVSTLDLEEVLEESLPVVLELTKTEAAEVWLLDPVKGVLEIKAHKGDPPEVFFQRQHFRVGEGLPGIAIATLQPVIAADIASDPRVLRTQLIEAGFKAMCAFPMVSHGKPLGVLCVACRDHQWLQNRDDSLLARMADALAIAIQNAQLFAQVENLAAERARLLALAEQERARLEALVQASPVGIFVAEASGRVSLINREAERILGLSLQPGDTLQRYEQAVTYRRPDGQVYAPADLPLQRALYQGETVRAEEVRMEFPDGHSIPTMVNATPVYSPSGDITAAIAVIQDMTPLEEVERLGREFLGMVSHELKTPLTAIKGSAATVLGSRRPFSVDETRELFEIIDEQADCLRELVDNLLDMTRIEAGSLSVSPEPTDLRTVLEEARATFVRSGGRQPVELHMPEGVPLVSADRRRVTQVVNNLLSNAAKFSPPTAPIHIHVEPQPSHLIVRVIDQGRGIPPEKLPLLFKKFSRVHEDSGAKLSGSGLGLAICKGIIEAHGGRIWAESQGLGHGATFTFTLYLASQSPAPLPSTTRRADHLGRVRRPGERTRILAVDDEHQVLRLLQRSLDEAGYQPIVTSDPSQVTKIVEKEEPDLVLLDLMLPGVSGFDLLRQIREFSGVPVIFLTASDHSEDTVRALKMGADDYITKPFSVSELLARIEASLRRRVLVDQMEVRPPFVLGDLMISFSERRVTVGGQVVSLSATEYKLLYELATNAGRVLTHDQILQRVWGPEYSGETELVRSFIRNLRRKLGDDARNPRYIFTEPQVGYRMPRPSPSQPP